MDESLATAVIDVGGRPYAVIDLPFRGERVGGAAAAAGRARPRVVRADRRARRSTCAARGRNDHHLAEAAFKALGRALRVACELDPRRDGVASTKGVARVSATGDRASRVVDYGAGNLVSIDQALTTVGARR